MEPSQNKLNLPRESISVEDAQKIQSLATKIVYAISDCGPIVIANVGGIKKESSRISGFQTNKAKKLIEDIVEDFLLKGY